MQPLWKTVWNFLRKLKMELPFDPEILLLGLLWGTVPRVGNVAQPPLGKPVGSEVGGQDPRPWISSPVGNQACIVLRLL